MHFREKEDPFLKVQNEESAGDKVKDEDRNRLSFLVRLSKPFVLLLFSLSLLLVAEEKEEEEEAEEASTQNHVRVRFPRTRAREGEIFNAIIRESRNFI